MDPSIEEQLRSILQDLDSQYNKKYTTAKDFDKMPAIKKFYEDHVVGTPYSLSFVKCEDPSCCQPMRSPPNVRELALQRQPTPKLDRTDKNRTGHYLTRTEALRGLSNGNAKATYDLSDLPSKISQMESSANSKEKTARDAEVTKALVLRSWENKKVTATVICFNCNKARCQVSLFNNGRWILGSIG